MCICFKRKSILKCFKSRFFTSTFFFQIPDVSTVTEPMFNFTGVTTSTSTLKPMPTPTSPPETTTLSESLETDESSTIESKENLDDRSEHFEEVITEKTEYTIMTRSSFVTEKYNTEGDTTTVKTGPVAGRSDGSLPKSGICWLVTGIALITLCFV